ncbi:hypothetical protein DHEL01_v207368 [Diaporthe helianthi]|uniref:Zn(2)-C6 fungal-type domain-containing protein n=1 Tax=Diaporthe helianthi TaxID=158607 RepID=A0A2P5HVI1_DIAHE|nr:hypothetical protein DHEL01_v207368 [Diaporthe helianthi]
MSRSLTFSNLSAETFETGQKGIGRKGPRHREAISCLPCRSRKVRCSRELPCRQCRDRSHECIYTKPPRTKIETTPSRPSSTISLATVPGPNHVASGPNTQDSQLRWASSADEARLGSEGTKKSPHQLKYPSPPNSVTQNVVEAKTLPLASPNFGSRLLGATHWMAPCKEMLVIKAMLDGSDGFVTNRKAFTELMDKARSANTIPPPLTNLPSGLDAACLRQVLDECSAWQETRQWAQHYLEGWGRIYQIVDATTLSMDMDTLQNTADVDDAHENPGSHASLLRVSMVVAVAMQRSHQHRLQGRRLGKTVEDFLYATSGSREPCIGLVQTLLLLLVLKTIAASDTDSMSSCMGVQGLTSQVVLAIGLHRDPSLFPGDNTYQRETRKRLWACYLRLSLEHSVRAGSPFPVHLEDTDCPLPSIAKLSTSDDLTQNLQRPRHFSDPDPQQTDALFGLEAAKLARVLVPIHRALCSPNPNDSQCKLSMEEVRSTFETFISDIPPSLRLDGASKIPVDVILILQRSILSINMQSVSLMVALRQLLCQSPDPSQKAQLMDVCDHAISILDVLQNVLQLGEHGRPDDATAADAAEIAHQLLWPDAVRAAMYACILVSRMRRLDSGRMLWSSGRGGGGRNTIASVCQSLLSTPLSFMCRFWQTRFRLGPVATKVSLLLAVALTVTSNLDASADPAARDWPQESKDRFMRMGVAVVDEWVAGMKAALEMPELRDSRDGDIVRPIVCTTAAELLPVSNSGPLVTPSSSLSSSSTPYNDMPEPTTSSSLSTGFTTNGGVGDFDFDFNGIFGYCFDFDNMESFMMGGTGGYDYGVSPSPTTHITGGLEEFL